MRLRMKRASIRMDILKERTTYEIFDPKSVGVPGKQAGAGEAQWTARVE